ncbi:MAG: YlbF family regulator [Ruminococcaceae bacterium]|nr:YlbF family regulator [Oscillospiraceae bacterium]
MDVILKARELGKAIQESEAYKEMEEARRRSDANLELQERISDFNLKKIALNREVNREEKNSDKIAQYDRELRQAYMKIMEIPDMTAYANAKQKVDQMMQKVQMLIDLTLQGNDPETVEIPENMGCSGNCSDCGGGCH